MKKDKHLKQKSTPSRQEENKRGRPKKEFMLKPKTIKREGPGRPKKEERPKNQEKKIKHHLENAQKKIQALYSSTVQETKRKDTVIFGIFLVSLGVFAFSLYITYQKQHPSIQEIPSAETLQQENTNTGDIQTTQTAETIETNNTWNTTTEKNISSNTTIISARYTALNNQDRASAFELIDPKLRQSNTFKTYFSQKRLSRFINNLTEWKITRSEIQSGEETLYATSPNNTTTTYTLTYTLLNQESYTEQREASLSKKEGKEQISKLRCITTGCSRMPFFNPGKYQIK